MPSAAPIRVRVRQNSAGRGGRGYIRFGLRYDPDGGLRVRVDKRVAAPFRMSALSRRFTRRESGLTNKIGFLSASGAEPVSRITRTTAVAAANPTMIGNM